ncbi:DUF3298 domain-containing protein [Paenibacillus koleovorans]|uniref:DUF3298 domain-containing protein n=1 Tax=Paenibacillus koleovorans TaxID=121608 RepID=UPI000FD9770A|nr:DUF3298 domain-containing protein [Paenibacillus koleovorans]
MKKSFKLLTLGVAGMVLLSGAQWAFADVAAGNGAVTAVPISAVMPISAKLSSIQVTAKELKSETPELKINMEIPVVSGMKDERYQAQLNDTIERLAMEDLDNAKKEAKEAAEHAVAGNFPLRQYELIVKGDVKSIGGVDNADRLSFTVTTYLATPGTGMPRVDTYNVLDAAEAKPVQLSELFGADYKAILDKEVNAQIAANPDPYFKGDMGFKGIAETQSFYVQGDEAVLVFPKYSIAPGSTGTPEFRVALPATNAAAAAVKFGSKEIKSETPELKLNVTIPVLSGMKDAKKQAELNAAIESLASEDIEKSKAEAKTTAEHAVANNFPVRQYELFVKADVKADGGAADKDRISFTVTTYLQTPGTGMPRVDTYNYTNTAEAKKIELSDLFGADYKAILDKEVSAQIAANPDKYFKGDMGYKGISDTQSFYVQGGEAVLVFPKYSIAPGVSGTPEFRVALPTGSEVAKLEIVLAADQLQKSSDGVALVPLRLAGEQLGFTVTWVEATRSAELSKGAQWTAVYEGKDSYSRNKMAPVQLGTAPVIIGEKLYVPQSFFSDILLLTVTVN